MTRVHLVEAEDHSVYDLDPVSQHKGRLKLIKKGKAIPDNESFMDSIDGYPVYRRIYDPDIFASRHEISTEIGPCLEIMSENTVGYGYRLILKGELGKESPDALRNSIQEERQRIYAVLNKMNPKLGLIEVLKRAIIDKNSDGNRFIEVVRNDFGEIIELNHIPAQTMLIGKSKRDIKKVWRFMDPIWKNGKVVDYKLSERTVRNQRFNVFFSVKNQKKVFFKEFGDPRKYRGATEIIWSKIYRSNYKYGLPRYIGAWLPLEGGRKAEEVNFNTFRNNCVPAMAILVSGGKVSDGTIDRIRDYLRSVKESDNYAKVLIIEAETSEEFFQTQQQIKVALKPLIEAQHSDALFQNYQENVKSKILQAFKLPPLFLGLTGNLNRATAQAARQLADEQVFDPERKDIEFMFNNLLFPEMGVKYHEFKLNSPSITDNQAIATILNQLERTGAVTPEIGRWAVETIFNREFPIEGIEGFDFKKPYSLQLAEEATSSNNPTSTDSNGNMQNNSSSDTPSDNQTK